MIVALTGTGPPFARLVEALAAYAAEHPDQEIWVQHGTSELCPPLDGVAFLPRTELIERLRNADVVVTHAGSGSLGDAMSVGHIPVVVPRRAALGEIVNDHQIELLDALEREGRVIGVRDLSQLGAAIEKAAERGRRPPDSAQGASLRRAVQGALPREKQRGLRQKLVWSLLAAATRRVRLQRLGP